MKIFKNKYIKFQKLYNSCIIVEKLVNLLNGKDIKYQYYYILNEKDS